MGKVTTLRVKHPRSPRRKRDAWKPVDISLEQVVNALPPGACYQMIRLASQRLNWTMLLPLPPGKTTLAPDDLVVGMVLGRARYTDYIEQILGTEHSKAYTAAGGTS